MLPNPGGLPRSLILLALVVLAASCGAQGSRAKPPGDRRQPAGRLGDQSSAELDCELVSESGTNDTPSMGPGGGPSAPNRTLLLGLVGEIWQIPSSTLNIQPEMPIYIAEVIVIEASAIEGSIDNLEGREGETICLLSKAAIPSEALGRQLEAQVTWRGDERAGMYWIVGEEVSIRERGAP